MKYIKSISLFFVYPVCCFLMGIYASSFAGQKEETEFRMEEEVSLSEEEEPESVMSNRALPEMVLTDYQQINMREGYFITVENGYVTVFTADRSVIYMTTGIKAEELPGEVEETLRTGVYVPDEGVLYDFLESYTS